MQLAYLSHASLDSSVGQCHCPAVLVLSMLDWTLAGLETLEALLVSLAGMVSEDAFEEVIELVDEDHKQYLMILHSHHILIVEEVLYYKF